ncbi:neurogenic locus notch homolog protein 4-like [Thrips palmi]|uniref:Neurogenic locus notch homolog protein 4-like n=1 Tax=Thrips palmi TaxID=161013 RepID=A0A6P9ACL4_THRPL|nr:neurogenic locus notch homolog protein 4-like [Thrips palmi]
MQRASSIAFAVLLAAAFCAQLQLQVSAARPSCDVGQHQAGCRIHVGMCVCGIGCRNEYQYSDKEECMKALKGQRLNQCGETPCKHGGACSQTTMDPGFKCRCEGTGFYGPRCQYPCPSPGSPGSGRPFPYECVLI